MNRQLTLWVLALFLAGSAGCSLRRLAADKLGDALAAGGTTFSSDNDPELVEQALPFSLKLMESVLAETPRHRGLLQAACKGFTEYAYGFVQAQAEMATATDLERSRKLQGRAKRLYLRARDYGLRALEEAHSGFAKALAEDPRGATGRLVRKDEVGALFWLAASWGAAIAVDKTDAALMADLPRVAALLDRAVALDEAFDNGALHSVLISFEMIRQDQEGRPADRAKRHLERAVELSGGGLAGPYVAYAEAVCIPGDDRAGFLAHLDKALAVDADARPEVRLENLLAQRRARWLRERVDQFFLPPLPEP